MMIIRGFSRVSKKGEAKRRRDAYAPLTITYRDGTVKVYKTKDFMADGSLKRKEGTVLCLNQ